MVYYAAAIAVWCIKFAMARSLASRIDLAARHDGPSQMRVRCLAVVWRLA